MEQRELFRTDHIYLTAHLNLRGHRIVRTEEHENHTFFVFDRSDALDRDVTDFHADGSVPARSYALALLRVKKLIQRKDEEVKKWNRTLVRPG
jgi:hypothetical protein